MHQGWRSRAPKELLAPHDDVVSVLRSLLAIRDAINVFARLLKEVAGLPPVNSTLQTPARCPRDVYAVTIDRDRAARLTIELARSRVYLSERLVSLRDLCMTSDGFPANPLIEVEEIFGAVQDRPVEVHGIWSVSWHQAIMSYGYGEFFTILDELGFNETYPDADEYSERCATFDQCEMQAYLTAFTRLGDGRFDESHLGEEYGVWENELRKELFRAWMLSRSLTRMPDSSDATGIMDSQDGPDTTETLSTSVTDDADEDEDVGYPSPSFRETVQLSPKEQEILDLIGSVGERMTTGVILRELEARRGPTSEGTTKMALSHLRRMGFLTNRQDVSPKGYGLAEWG